VIAHHKLAHRGGPNASSAIRYQVYFRVRHRRHDEHVASGALLEDLWVEFDPAVQAIARAKEAAAATAAATAAAASSSGGSIAEQATL
jgi:hypothetical protein